MRARASGSCEPSTRSMRSGKSSTSSPVGLVDARDELVVLPLDAIALLSAAAARLLGGRPREEGAVGEQALRRVEVQLAAPGRRRGRARFPGTRATSRCSGRRGPPRRGRAPGGSRSRRAARGRPRRARPRPTGRSPPAGGGRRRGSSPRSRCRPAPSSSRPRVPRRARSCATSSTCVVFPEPSRPSKVTNTRGSIEEKKERPRARRI